MFHFLKTKKDNLIKEEKRIKSFIWGRIIGIIQFISTLVLMGLLLYLDILPVKYVLIIFVILMFFVIYTFASQYTKGFQGFGRGLSILITLFLVFGNYLLLKTNIALENITKIETKLDEVSILVSKDDPATSIDDLVDYTFGYHETLDKENSLKTIESIKKDMDIEIKLASYTDFNHLLDDFFQGKVKVIILNEAYRETLNEIVENFDKETKTLSEHIIETKVDTDKIKKESIKEPFYVYISGIDTYGSISKQGRSDVNIIATVNPNRKQVLLVTTPRDYYVNIPKFDQKDKLTHAGIFGIDTSLETLEELYDIKINYYIRVNFTSLVDIVNALDGITVYSEQDFESLADRRQYPQYHFKKGYNKLNGLQALAFSRERKAFEKGDYQRGKNQLEVLKGIAQKALSPTILMNYGKIMDAISNSFETNMNTKDIKDLIGMQIKDNTKWTIKSISVTGSNAFKTTYTYSSKKLAVIVPDRNTIESAKNSMEKILNGK